VVVYKKGATELLRRLAAQPPAATEAAAQAAAVEAAARQAQALAAQARALARQAQAAAQAARARGHTRPTRGTDANHLTRQREGAPHSAPALDRAAVASFHLPTHADPRGTAAPGGLGAAPPCSPAMGWQPRRAGMAAQRDASSALRCHAGESGADCRVGRARLRAGPTPYNSPGGDGGEAEGRTPFEALSADARGGLKARSAFRQCTPRANLKLSPGTSRRRFPACAVPATAPHQRASGPRDASTGSCSRAIRSGAGMPWRRERRGLASLRLRARTSRRSQGNRRARRCRAAEAGSRGCPRAGAARTGPPPAAVTAGLLPMPAGARAAYAPRPAAAPPQVLRTPRRALPPPTPTRPWRWGRALQALVSNLAKISCTPVRS
jgi:hypothetical protein